MTDATVTPDATDAVALTRALVRCPSVTPHEGGALALLESVLVPLGFEVSRPVFSAEGTPDVENLFAIRRGEVEGHLLFAGHTDVVPPGPVEAWTHAPFAAEIADDTIHGRGTEDMKGGIACFIAAIAGMVEDGAPLGTISLLITGDEEGPAVNGTVRLLEWAYERGYRFDAALVGEPTNVDKLGDTMKIGRRGSVTGELVVHGRQGHAAYPDRADNAVRGMTVLLGALLAEPLDEGTAAFQPTNLEVTTVDVGNAATNVVPGEARALFNIRHNDLWTAETLQAEIGARLDRAAVAPTPLRRRDEAINYSLEWRTPPSPCFLTKDEALISALSRAVARESGRTPEPTTGGGTSDARFIKDYCPVVEFGLVGRTMHQVDERVPVREVEQLARVYRRFVAEWFGT